MNFYKNLIIFVVFAVAAFAVVAADPVGDRLRAFAPGGFGKLLDLIDETLHKITVAVWKMFGRDVSA